jgi:uncharacterized protein YhaN
MYLHGLHIYGYGKLEDVRIQNLQNLQVFYGENEAGKSTIMAFIHGVLFGFPTRQQSELRYEPKLHSKYGGYLKAEFPSYGIAVIERVKGKAAGDVTVTLQDGRVGGQELLDELLGGMDRGTYQSIFSFSLQGLQNIQQIKGDDLGRFLFSAGTLGSDRLLRAEDSLQKELEQRFKPGGKKPRLNEKLKQLRDTYEMLKKAEAEADEYSTLLTRKAATEEKLLINQSEIAETEKQVFYFKELERVYPLLIEIEKLEANLVRLGELTFPADGLRRLERIEERLQPIEARLAWLSERSKTLAEESEVCEPDRKLLAREAEISSALDNLPVFEQTRAEAENHRRMIDEVMEDIERVNDQLHARFNEQTIGQVNVSSAMKEMAENIQMKQQQLKDRKLRLDADFQEEKTVLEELESQTAFYKGKLLDEKTKERIGSQLQTLEEQEKLKSELHRVQERIASFKSNQASSLRKSKAEQKRQGSTLLFFGLIFLLLALWGIWNRQWVVTAAGAAGFIPVLSMYFRLVKSGTGHGGGEQEELSWAKAQEEELKARLQGSDNLDAATLRNMLVQDEENRRMYLDYSGRLEMQNARYEKVIQLYEAWEGEAAETNSRQEEVAEQLHLLHVPGTIKIFDAFLLVEKQKLLFREKKRLEDRLSFLEAQQKGVHSAFRELAAMFLHNENLAIQEAAALLKKRMREEYDKQARYREVTSKLDEVKEETSRLANEQKHLKQEKEKLLKLAGVLDEESFREIGLKALQEREWKSRLEELAIQLESSGIKDSRPSEASEGNLPAERLEKALLQLESYKMEQNEILNSLAEIRHRMSVLEEGLYPDLLHKYNQLKYEFREEAKEWAGLAVARELLRGTVERYRRERLPKLLAKAEEFLQDLTRGQYIRILPQQSGSGFLVERQDHTLFEANELSQATAEQVYVSLRLALASALYSRFPYPIIIDDSFVNFDEERTQMMFQLLRGIPQNQVLFFTCHRHLLDQFKNEEILPLRQLVQNSL